MLLQSGIIANVKLHFCRNGIERVHISAWVIRNSCTRWVQESDVINEGLSPSDNRGVQVGSSILVQVVTLGFPISSQGLAFSLTQNPFKVNGLYVSTICHPNCFMVY